MISNKNIKINKVKAFMFVPKDGIIVKKINNYTISFQTTLFIEIEIEIL